MVILRCCQAWPAGQTQSVSTGQELKFKLMVWDGGTGSKLLDDEILRQLFIKNGLARHTRHSYPPPEILWVGGVGEWGGEPGLQGRAARNSLHHHHHLRLRLLLSPTVVHWFLPLLMIDQSKHWHISVVSWVQQRCCYQHGISPSMTLNWFSTIKLY